MEDSNDNTDANSEPETETKQEIVKFDERLQIFLPTSPKKRRKLYKCELKYRLCRSDLFNADFESRASERFYSNTGYVRSRLFKYFTKLYPQSEKTAKCNICERVLTYKTTIANLKMHILRKHPEILRTEPCLKLQPTSDIDGKSKVRITLNPDVLEENEYSGDESKPKRRRGRMWRFFRKVKPYEEKKAECMVCLKRFSYKTTSTNLKSHIGKKHTELVRNDEYFTEYVDKLRKSSRNHEKLSPNRKKVWEYFELASDDDDNGNNQNESDEAVKLTSQIWSQFNHDDEEPTCNICREMVTSRLEDMKNHLEEKHPDVLDQIASTALDATSEGDLLAEDNIYTEIVYLDEEQNKIKESRKTQYPQRDMLNIQGTTKKKRLIPKRERNRSESSEEYVQRNKKEKVDSTDELDVFMSYLKVLLRKVPEENSPKLHLDIINLVMSATQPPQTSYIIEKLNGDFSLGTDASKQGNNSVNNIQLQNDTNSSNGVTNIANTCIDGNSIGNNQGAFITVPIHQLSDSKNMPRLVTISSNIESQLATADKLQNIKRIIASVQSNSTLNNSHSAHSTHSAHSAQPTNTSINE